MRSRTVSSRFLTYTAPVLAFLLCAPLLLAQDVPDPAEPPVVVVRLDGELHESWASILRRGLDTVQQRNAPTVILELDTPGGEIELMKRLGKQIEAMSAYAETIAFINSRALSAGSYLAMSCDQIWMTPGASIGAAMPIMVGPGGILPQLDEDLQEKMVTGMRAEFRSLADRRGRNPNIAEAFVDNKIELKLATVDGERRILTAKEFDDYWERGSEPVFLQTVCASGELLTFTTREAREYGYAEGEAADLPALQAALGFSVGSRVTVETTWSEDLVDFIGSYSWLLLLGAAFFIVVAFNMPGLGAPEGAAVLCLALFLFHNYLVGLAEWTEVLLVVAGLVLIAVELFVTPGLIFPAVGGGMLLLLGLLLAMQDFVFPEGGIEMRAFRHNLLVIVGVGISMPIIGTLAMRSFTKTRYGQRLMTAPEDDFGGAVASVAGASGESLNPEPIAVGSEGHCVTPLRPSGMVQFDDQRLDARSSGAFLEAGSPVYVLRVEGGTVVVAPKEGA